MILDITDLYENYNSKVDPFIHNGVIIDTSVIDILVEGLISSRISRKESPEFEKILRFLELIRLSNKWNKFYITPHILTEACTHLKNRYNKWKDYTKIVNEVMPILKDMKEPSAIRNCDILEQIELKHPVIEVGDISIFITANNFGDQKQKVAILTNDSDFGNRYSLHPHVLIMDYQNVILNAL